MLFEDFNMAVGLLFVDASAIPSRPNWACVGELVNPRGKRNRVLDDVTKADA